MGRFRLTTLSAVVLASIPFTRTALAGDPKEACLAASDHAQQFKLDGKLLSARQQLLICERAECPQIVRQDCAQWLSEVMSALPSVVIGARDADGHDVFAVRVSIDGKLASEKLDGKPILIDPGAHEFRYEMAGAPPVQEQVLVREGEKNRALTVTFQGPPGASSSTTTKTTVTTNAGDTTEASPSPEGEAPAPSAGAPPALAWIMAGVGVVALGSALYFDLSATSDVNDLRQPPPTGCAPNCNSDQVDPIRTKYVVAGVSLGVGLVAAGVATYLFLVHPAPASPPAKTEQSSGLTFDLHSLPGGGEASLGGRF